MIFGISGIQLTLLKWFFVTQDGSPLLVDNKLFSNGLILGCRRIV